MFSGVDHISIAVIANDKSMDWASKMGDVHLAIALVMPEKPTREQIIAATNLTRNLLTDQMAERLLLTKSSVDLQALLMYAMSSCSPKLLYDLRTLTEGLNRTTIFRRRSACTVLKYSAEIVHVFKSTAH